MAIKPVSGKIESQEINDNLSYLDSQKASKEDLSKVIKGPTEVHETKTALTTKYPNGAKGVHLVLSDGHLYFWNDSLTEWIDAGIYQARDIPDHSIDDRKIKDKTISIGKLDFSKVGKNLFDRNKVVEAYIGMNSGKEYPSDTYYSSDYMPVIGSTYYRPRYQCRIIWYRDIDVFLSSAGQETPDPNLGAETSAVMSPNEARYARVSFRSINSDMLKTFQFEQGTERTPPEPYFHLLSNTITVDESRVESGNTEFEYNDNEELVKVIDKKTRTLFFYEDGNVSHIITEDLEFNTIKRTDFIYENGYLTKINERFL